MPESRHRLSLVAVPVAKSIDKRPHDCMIHLGIASRNTKAYRPSVLRPAAPKTHCKHSIKVFLSNWRESTTRGNRYSQAAYGLYVFTHCVSFISIAIMTTSRQAHASKIFDASSNDGAQSRDCPAGRGAGMTSTLAHTAIPCQVKPANLPAILINMTLWPLLIGPHAPLPPRSQARKGNARLAWPFRGTTGERDYATRFFSTSLDMDGLDL